MVYVNKQRLFLFMAFFCQLILAGNAYGVTGYDFLLKSTDCKISRVTFSNLRAEVHTRKADDLTLVCNRRNGKIFCYAKYKNGTEDQVFENTIFFDNPPFLAFGDPKGSDYAWVNTNEQAGAYHSRMLAESGMAVKVCKFIYLTN